MATETDTSGETASGFGRVSRRRDVAFRYLLLSGTLVGLVALSVLLVYVAIDAVRPMTASPIWYLVFSLTFVVPSVLVGGYLRSHNRPAWRVGLVGIVVPVAGLFGAGTLGLLFDVIPSLVWFAWAVALALPAALYLGYRTIRPRASLRERTAVALALAFASVVGIPPVVPGIPDFIQFTVPVIPNRYVTYVLTLALPGAVLVGRRVARVEKSRRAGILAGVLVGLAALSVVFQVVLDPVTALVLVLTIAVPTVYYVATTLRHRPDARVGLLLPVVVFGGAVLGSVLVDLFSLHGPEAWVDWQFLTSLPSRTPEQAGIYPALVGSVLLMIVVVAMTFPVGVGAAVYLEEYAPDSWYTRLIRVNISNLAGVPSVVYGLLGLGLFINLGGLSGESVTVAGRTTQLSGVPTGSLLAGGLALSLLILPIVIISSQEAIRSVPDSLKQASYGMGATRWQTVRNVVLPRAIPGILTGTILAIGRAVGEAAPLLMILAPTYTTSVPTSLFEKASAMPLQVYQWAFEIEYAFRHGVLAAGVVTMLVVLLAINSVAIVLRNRYQSER